MTSQTTEPPTSATSDESGAHKKRYDTFTPNPKVVERKRKQHQEQIAQERKTKRRDRFRNISVLSAILLIILTLAALRFVVSQAQTSREMPGSLIGIWQSDDPRYADRQLTIRLKTITFDESKRDERRYLVQKVTLAESTDGLHFTIETIDGKGVDHQYSVVSHPDNRNRFWFQNRPDVIWRK
ncbi:MAG: hypothetical protein GY906_00755 [bacterium]|nr:hypothetical protein [bacterium]